MLGESWNGTINTGNQTTTDRTSPGSEYRTPPTQTCNSRWRQRRRGRSGAPVLRIDGRFSQWRRGEGRGAGPDSGAGPRGWKEAGRGDGRGADWPGGGAGGGFSRAGLTAAVGNLDFVRERRARGGRLADRYRWGAAVGRRLQLAVGSGAGGGGWSRGECGAVAAPCVGCGRGRGPPSPGPAGALSPLLPPRDAEAAGGAGPAARLGGSAACFLSPRFALGPGRRLGGGRSGAVRAGPGRGGAGTAGGGSGSEEACPARWLRPGARRAPRPLWRPLRGR